METNCIFTCQLLYFFTFRIDSVSNSMSILFYNNIDLNLISRIVHIESYWNRIFYIK